MKLSVIQYDAIMQAIMHYRDTVTNEGIDLYDNTVHYTADDILKALNEVEIKIMDANIPF